MNSTFDVAVLVLLLLLMLFLRVMWIHHPQPKLLPLNHCHHLPSPFISALFPLFTRTQLFPHFYQSTRPRLPQSTTLHNPHSQSLSAVIKRFANCILRSTTEQSWIRILYLCGTIPLLTQSQNPSFRRRLLMLARPSFYDSSAAATRIPHCMQHVVCCRPMNPHQIQQPPTI